MDATGETLCWSTSEGGMETLDIHGFGPLGRFRPMGSISILNGSISKVWATCSLKHMRFA